VQNGGGEAGGHYGVDSIEGIIAVFWCDLNPDVATDGQGVYYNVVTTTNPLVTAWNKFIVQWIVPVFGTTNLCHFEAILSGDGTVQLLYVDMPAESGSWARESIGFEDQTGTQGAQILYGVVPDTSDGPVAYTIPAQCHAALGEDVETCCSTQICQCEGVSCVVDTDAEYAWVEIIDSGLGTRIETWENNGDDGWFHVQLPFDFNWFGTMETTITIGTNGAITFGTDQLPYGDSEPVPCQWNGAGQGAGGNGCVQNAGGEAGDHYGGDSIEGIIAVFWCDLNPADTVAESDEGVYYQVVRSDASQTNAQLEAFNRVVVSYTVPVFGTENLCQFQAILLGDGTVIMQYKDMPADSGSWSVESIGFEDRTGTLGVQISYGFTTPVDGTAYRIDPSCHVPAGELPEGLDACCTDRVCECEGVPEECVVDTGLDIVWVDIVGTGTRIANAGLPGGWENNGDDGWFHIDLSFPFNWFGRVERRITVGTNGVLTFGDAQLPYGDSEPVPCQWNGAGQGDGRSGCVQDPTQGVERGGHYGVEIDGIIAAFWCDLNPDACNGGDCGVYYQEIVPADSNRGSGRNLINLYSLVIEYNIPVFGQAADQLCHFEVILSGDGSVLLQYLDMPDVSGSWSAESIGFEDQTGAAGVQIAYGEVPPPGSAFDIPSSCHVSSYNADLNEEGTCCTSQVCMCEDVTCNIETDYTFEWVEIIDNARGIQITNWEQNADDGWYDVPLPFDFLWFGNVERMITVGTNGVLSFGSGHLPYGASEPCPCTYGDAACNHGAQMEGVIAPFWADLNPDVADGGAHGKGVFYQIIQNDDPRLVSWNKLIVTWDCETFYAAGYGLETNQGHVVQVQLILMADGSLIYQYNEMPPISGSWSHESIGFEDQGGSKGVQILYGESPPSHTAYHIPPSCHVTRGDEGATTCCTSLICQCEDVQCEVQTDYQFEWMDIIDNGVGTRIDSWQQNADDGWFHLDLPFDFLWFGNVERTITIGTNGVLTFGAGQLPYGASEPCPCTYGDASCNNGASVEGVIAPFWADLNPAVAVGENGEGVYYQIIEAADPVIVAWNKLIVEWRVPTFWAAGYNIQTDSSHMVHLECILMGGGAVLFQYADMPPISGSWSHESIGFEDRSGTKGVQISFGSTPPPNTAYFIPTACHVTGTEDAATGACSCVL
jgi:hypothetical protein